MWLYTCFPSMEVYVIGTIGILFFSWGVNVQVNGYNCNSCCALGKAGLALLRSRVRVIRGWWADVLRGIGVSRRSAAEAWSHHAREAPHARHSHVALAWHATHGSAMPRCQFKKLHVHHVLCQLHILRGSNNGQPAIRSASLWRVGSDATIGGLGNTCICACEH